MIFNILSPAELQKTYPSSNLSSSISVIRESERIANELSFDEIVKCPCKEKKVLGPCGKEYVSFLRCAYMDSDPLKWLGSTDRLYACAQTAPEHYKEELSALAELKQIISSSSTDSDERRK